MTEVVQGRPRNIIDIVFSIITAASIVGMVLTYESGKHEGKGEKRDKIVNSLLEDRKNIAYDAKLLRTAAEQDSALREAGHISSVLKRLYREGQLEGISEGQFYQIFPDSSKPYLGF